METAIIQAFRTPLPEEPPGEIQWMPPGRHRINVMKNGKAVQMEVDVNEDTARAVAASMDRIRAGGDDTYLDFNHAGAEASGWVDRVWWGGPDPQTGGIRAGVRWSAAGEAALRGKSFKRFSPTFLRDESSGAIVGTTPNMGGLVNLPAFKQLVPIVAHEPNNQEADMTDETKRLEASIQAKEATIEAQKTRISELESRITQMEQAQVQAAEANARAAVNTAVQAGRIAPKDTAMQERWVKIIAADAANIEALNSLPQTYKVDAGRVTQTPSGEPGVPDDMPPAERIARQRSKVEAYRAQHGGSFDSAFQACAAADPALFN